MTYTTFINTAYWTLAAFIILLAWICVGMGVAILLLRGRRFREMRRERELRWLLIEAARESRAAEDAYWFLLRGRDARLARQLRDSRAVVNLVADLRAAPRKLEAV